MDQDIKQRGFTLIETFVAITILMVLIVGPLGSLSKSITDTQYAQNLATATYLSQEALNAIAASLQNAAQLHPIDPGSFEDLATVLNTRCSGGNCGVNTIGSFVIDLCGRSNLNNCILKRDPSTNIYRHDVAGGQNTIFTRRVTITSGVNDLNIWTSNPSLTPSPIPREIRVTVTTSWSEGAQLRQVSITGVHWSSQVYFP